LSHSVSSNYNLKVVIKRKGQWVFQTRSVQRLFEFSQ
jgi:hypothetical protein